LLDVVRTIDGTSKLAPAVCLLCRTLTPAL
jgi:hypothetical protein